MVLDITDIKEAEQRQRLLFDELNHRVKNTLAIVQALALQTLQTRPQPDEFADAFSDRLGSLARAHSLLTENSWRGASLQDIVATALSAFVDEGRSIDIGGDAVMVPAGATVTLSLMLHELATNAAKYGALSVAEGTAGGAMDRRPDGRGHHGRPALAGGQRPAGVAADAPRLRYAPARQQRPAARRRARPRLCRAGPALPAALSGASPLR